MSVLPADIARCAGKRLITGQLLGLCIACERQTAPPIDHPWVAHTEPPAVRDEQGVWQCELRIPAAMEAA